MQGFSFRGGEIDGTSIANVLMLLSQNREEVTHFHKRVYECKTCYRQFPSFQALGGHRASHKKPRLSDDGQNAEAQKPKVHECSICGLEFAIGQALGGHMRRHRATSAGGRFRQGIVEKSANGKRVLLFDLNLVPEGEDIIECQEVAVELELGDGLGLELGLGLGVVEKTPMVDCIH